MQIIRIDQVCEGWIEKSVPRITNWHHEACRVMKNGDSKDGFFYPILTQIMDSLSCSQLSTAYVTDRSAAYVCLFVFYLSGGPVWVNITEISIWCARKSLHTAKVVQLMLEKDQSQKLTFEYSLLR